MVLNKEGNPLLATSERRDEVVRCIGIIGWSWQKFADRMELKLAGALLVKNCKREIPDSDLRWLQELADAVSALPRPAVANDPESPDVARLQAPIVSRQSSEDAMANMAASAAIRAASSERDKAAEALAAAYNQASELSTEQAAGAKWAISEIAIRLGLLDEVKARLPAPPVVRAWQPPAPEQRVPLD